MHILHFCGALKGGPLTAIAEWAHQQIAEGHSVSLVYSPLRDPLDSFRADLPPEVALFPLEVRRDIHPISDFRACLRLAEMLRNIRPDILHLHSSKAGAVGRIAGRLTGVPTVYSTHGMAYLRTDVGIFSRAIYFVLEWVLGPIGTVSVACSPSELRSMRAIPGRKMDIPNGIDLAILPPPAERLGNVNLKIALCGRITAQKNPELACQVANLSPREWRWVWLGDGELGGMVSEAGITVSGWQPRAKAIGMLGASDVMLHTSSWEGMPIAILEAMAMGLPVVATNVIGNRDLVVQDKTGFIAADAAGILAALKTLAASPEKRHRMGSAGRRRVEQEFDQSKLTSRWLALYENIRVKS